VLLLQLNGRVPHDGADPVVDPGRDLLEDEQVNLLHLLVERRDGLRGNVALSATPSCVGSKAIQPALGEKHSIQAWLHDASALSRSTWR
jgi:hypothetical protein